MAGLPQQPVIPGLSRRKPRAPRQANPELVQQTHYFRFVRLYAVRYPDLRWIHSIPNGAYMPKKTACDMVGSGLTSGVWDTFIPVPRKWSGDACGYIAPGAYIEFKADRKGLSDKQKQFLRDVILPGHFGYTVARDWIAAAVFTIDYLGIEDPQIREMLR